MRDDPPPLHRAAPCIGMVTHCAVRCLKLLSGIRTYGRCGAEVVVLACTELPMVPVNALCESEGREPPALTIVDPAALLAHALLAQ